jgi:pimeloyl-ACP methyl ester carboxylesterase
MRVTANSIGIEIDDYGPPDGEPLLLIIGYGLQMIDWPEEFVRLLAAEGFRVIRHDNRDTGLSDGFDHLGTPSLIWAVIRYKLRLQVQPPYRMADMAADSVGVLDALGIERAHICGMSMGGTIAQHIAVLYPARCKSLTLMMTTTGARRLPQPKARIASALMKLPRYNDAETVVSHNLRVKTLIASPGFPPKPETVRQEERSRVERSWRPAGLVRQLAAVIADGDRSAMVARIKCPTCIIHGADDPLVPVAAAHDLARRIPGAVSEIIPGMGHDLPSKLLPVFVKCIKENASRPFS